MAKITVRALFALCPDYAVRKVISSDERFVGHFLREKVSGREAPCR